MIGKPALNEGLIRGEQSSHSLQPMILSRGILSRYLNI